MPSARYTLIIPTYNRPAYLRSLLGYLAARRFEYPIRILDSSFEQARAENQATVASSGLEIVHQLYDPDIHVSRKVRLGAETVDTPYASFCADDDVLFTRRIAPLLDVLDARPEFVAAHGYYLNFLPGQQVTLINTAYSAPSIEGENALARIVAQMRDYEAIFYAVHRTSVLQSVLSRIDSMQSLWAGELLSSSLELIPGGVYREQHFFMGRNTNPSIATEGWHPHHFFAKEPEELMREYAAYRSAVLAALADDAACRGAYTAEQMRRAFDLVHLRYLTPSLSPGVLDRMVEETIRPVLAAGGALAPDGQAPAADVLPRVLRRLVRVLRRLRRSQDLRELFTDAKRLLRILRDLNARGGFRTTPDARLAGAIVTRVDRTERPRRYLLKPTLLRQELKDGRRVEASHVADIIEHLDDYV